MTKYYTLALALLAVVMVSAPAHAFLGPAPAGTAVADYDPGTGQMTVSVNGVVNWYIESATLALTGASPTNLPGAGGAVSDNDQIVGETTGFISMIYTDVDLGNIAAPGLPLSDLTIFWNASLGGDLLSNDVVEAGGGGGENAPPVADLIATPSVVNIGIDPNTTLDASGSTDDGNLAALTYEFDLDNNGTYETDNGTSSMLGIDVTTDLPFTGFGDYTVGLRVFDGEFEDFDTTTISVIPEPATLALAGIALCGMFAGRRRRIA